MGMESTIKFTELKNSKEKRSLFVQVCGCHCYLCITTGEMAEWSIAAVLKTAVPQGTGGSNPSLSADQKARATQPGFFHGWSLIGPHFISCTVYTIY